MPSRSSSLQVQFVSLSIIRYSYSAIVQTCKQRTSQLYSIENSLSTWSLLCALRRFNLMEHKDISLRIACAEANRTISFETLPLHFVSDVGFWPQHCQPVVLETGILTALDLLFNLEDSPKSAAVCICFPLGFPVRLMPQAPPTFSSHRPGKY